MFQGSNHLTERAYICARLFFSHWLMLSYRWGVRKLYSCGLDSSRNLPDKTTICHSHCLHLYTNTPVQTGSHSVVCPEISVLWFLELLRKYHTLWNSFSLEANWCCWWNRSRSAHFNPRLLKVGDHSIHIHTLCGILWMFNVTFMQQRQKIQKSPHLLSHNWNQRFTHLNWQRSSCKVGKWMFLKVVDIHW